MSSVMAGRRGERTRAEIYARQTTFSSRAKMVSLPRGGCEDTAVSVSSGSEGEMEDVHQDVSARLDAKAENCRARSADRARALPCAIVDSEDEAYAARMQAMQALQSRRGAQKSKSLKTKNNPQVKQQEALDRSLEPSGQRGVGATASTSKAAQNQIDLYFKGTCEKINQTLAIEKPKVEDNGNASLAVNAAPPVVEHQGDTSERAHFEPEPSAHAAATRHYVLFDGTEVDASITGEPHNVTAVACDDVMEVERDAEAQVIVANEDDDMADFVAAQRQRCAARVSTLAQALAHCKDVSEPSDSESMLSYNSSSEDPGYDTAELLNAGFGQRADFDLDDEDDEAFWAGDGCEFLQRMDPFDWALKSMAPKSRNAKQARKMARKKDRLTAFPSDLMAMLEELVVFARDNDQKQFSPEVMGHLARKSVHYACDRMELDSLSRTVPCFRNPKETVRVLTVAKRKGYERRVDAGRIRLMDREGLERIVMRVYEESNCVSYDAPAWAIGEASRGAVVHRGSEAAQKARRAVRASEKRAKKQQTKRRPNGAPGSGSCRGPRTRSPGSSSFGAARRNNSTPRAEALDLPSQQITLVDQDVCTLQHKPINESNVGHQLLLTMGWTAGTGLGADGKGEVDPVTIKYRLGRKGLG
ncbi:G patch domain-containing protein 2 [Porphyridium purpureum]|uniref:G patch domain-containing protein 2 n=1 Tax=Porphyridium purpureum TaxID=35688 RepID=A0A5J4YLQ7_PORPP|nr:G patch domain-containing protein 2 [Porphyridium purpureum]|eukprot:POR5174..scf295_9